MIIPLDISWARLIEWSVQLLSHSLESQVQDRKRHYEERIAPAFALITEVHKDYTHSFAELSRMIRKEGVVTPEIVDWLEARRLERDGAREEVRSLMFELDDSAFFRAATVSDSKHVADIAVNSLRFVKDILAYFADGEHISSMTWYSRMIDALRDAARNHRYVGVLLIQDDVAGTIDSIYRDLLTEKYSRVCETHSRLRGLCLD